MRRNYLQGDWDYDPGTRGKMKSAIQGIKTRMLVKLAVRGSKGTQSSCNKNKRRTAAEKLMFPVQCFSFGVNLQPQRCDRNCLYAYATYHMNRTKLSKKRLATNNIN